MENPTPLLERLHSGEPVPRAEFLEIYSPFLSRILLSAGYSAAETETLLETFAHTVFGESERFVHSPERGTLPGFLHQILLRTLAELPPVAPETDMISPASVSLRLAAAALSPTTFGTMHSSVDFSAPR